MMWAVVAYILFGVAVIGGWLAIALAVFTHDQTEVMERKRRLARERWLK